MDKTTNTQKPRTGDMFPAFYPGMPPFAFVPNPYDGGRPAKVYPGDNTYYAVAYTVSTEDNTAMAIRRTVCDYMNQCIAAVTPAQAAAVEAGINYGWNDRRANPALYDAYGTFCG